MEKFLSQLLADKQGNPSTRRYIGWLAFIAYMAVQIWVWHDGECTRAELDALLTSALPLATSLLSIGMDKPAK